LNLHENFDVTDNVYFKKGNDKKPFYKNSHPANYNLVL
jgi:hypothetical protein